MTRPDLRWHCEWCRKLYKAEELEPGHECPSCHAKVKLRHPTPAPDVRAVMFRQGRAKL